LKNTSPLYLFAFLICLVAGVITALVSFKPESSLSIALEISDNIRREIKYVDEDVKYVSSANAQVEVEKLHYPIFVFQNSRLTYWSDNTFVPPSSIAADTFNIRLYKTASEAYLLKQTKMDAGRIAISAIKLTRSYAISNDYLTSEFNFRIIPSRNIIIEEVQGVSPENVCINNDCIFRVKVEEGDVMSHPLMKQIALGLLCIAVILFVLWLFAVRVKAVDRIPELRFLCLLLLLWGLRLMMTQTGFPGVLASSELFDPHVFAASSLNASLGDLFINLVTLLILCFYLFRHYFRFRIVSVINHQVFGIPLQVFSVAAVLFASLFPFVVVQTISNNSAIELDISQSLHFNLLRVIAILSVLIAGTCSFLFAHPFIRMLAKVTDRFQLIMSLGIAILVFAGINIYTHQAYVSSLIAGIVYLLAVYFFKVYKSLHRLSFATFAYLFLAILCLSVNGSYAVQSLTYHQKIEDQFRFANNFLIERDIFGEYLLHEVSEKVGNDAFIQSRLGSPFLGKEPVRQKIRQIFLPNYFNKYDIDIFLFNSTGEPLDHNVISLSSLINKYDQESYRTGYEGIYFLNNQQLDVSQKYLVIIAVKRGPITSGYVILQLSMKKILPENVYPELLMDFRVQEFYRTQDISYALYANNKTLFSAGDFNYDRFFNNDVLGNTDMYTTGLSFLGYDHIAVEDQNGKVAIVSTVQDPFTHKLANFSFLFVLGLLVILLMILIQGAYQYVMGSRLFFSARIQLYLNLAFFIPLIIVSISTLSLTSKSSQEQLNDEYLNKSKIFSQQMVNYMEAQDNEDEGSFATRLNDLTKLSDLDANVYSPSGVLTATSQPLIFENNLLTPYINGPAYARIRNGENLFIESEHVGKLSYFVAFAALKSPTSGRLIGILGIPFFQSAYLLEKIQLVILINILNIFAFIFIVLLALSYVVADRLTFPLRIITDSLRKTSLTKTNTPLTWAAEDEIGLMVKEYNAMLFKLSESKSELEQTQREKAWREIAQQVAHEIKNPLTPMKLTLQQLDRNIQAGTVTNEKTARAVSALLSQVDTLNDIASSFSGFVKMPEPVIESLDIIEVLKHTIDLHSPSGRILYKSAVKEFIVMGDRQLLSRTFSNIILNGLQSGKPGQAVELNITVDIMKNICRISFRDNGKGIEPAIADQVFVPHFSTKNSGSGLGLAIAKQAIEQMKGRIWFETEPRKGTSFFIELPGK
jgi:two-component system nitrogen regulation sensor histidine kinase NtrY